MGSSSGKCPALTSAADLPCGYHCLGFHQFLPEFERARCMLHSPNATFDVAALIGDESNNKRGHCKFALCCEGLFSSALAAKLIVLQSIIEITSC